MSDACTWPEQDAVDEWLEKHEIQTVFSERMELKKAVSAYRIAVQKESADRITELERQNAELVAAAQEVREWLKNNSEHPPYCDIDDNGHGCTCGLTDFLLPRKVGTSTAAPHQQSEKEGGS